MNGVLQDLDTIQSMKSAELILDNVKYDAELFLIHKHRVSQNHLFISIFLEVDDETNTSTDNFFKEISTNIPKKKSTEKVNLDLPKDFSLNKLLPGLKSFYNYKLEFGTNNKTTYHYVIFSNVIPIYYEYYINIKKVLKLLMTKGSVSDSRKFQIDRMNN